MVRAGPARTGGPRVVRAGPARTGGPRVVRAGPARTGGVWSGLDLHGRVVRGPGSFCLCRNKFTSVGLPLRVAVTHTCAFLQQNCSFRLFGHVRFFGQYGPRKETTVRDSLAWPRFFSRAIVNCYAMRRAEMSERRALHVRRNIALGDSSAGRQRETKSPPFSPQKFFIEKILWREWGGLCLADRIPEPVCYTAPVRSWLYIGTVPRSWWVLPPISCEGQFLAWVRGRGVGVVGGRGKMEVRGLEGSGGWRSGGSWRSGGCRSGGRRSGA